MAIGLCLQAGFFRQRFVGLFRAVENTSRVYKNGKLYITREKARQSPAMVWFLFQCHVGDLKCGVGHVWNRRVGGGKYGSSSSKFGQRLGCGPVLLCRGEGVRQN